MSRQQGHNNGGSGDETLFIGLAFVGLFGLLFYFVYPYFKEFFLTLKLWQLKIIAFLVPIDYHLSLLDSLRFKPSYEWTLDEVILLGYQVNYYFLPIYILFFYMVFMLIKDRLYIVRKYSKTYTAQSLMDQEKKVWKFLQPIAHLNLIDNPHRYPSAKKTQEIVEEYKLLNDKKDKTSFNEEKAKKYFAMQLGPLYTGMDNLPDAVKALVGCIAAHIMDEKEEAYYAFMDIAETFGEGNKVDFSAGLKLFEKYKNEKKINNIMNKNAYVTTAMANLFKHANGIIITQYFIWLKEYDRRLYYILNNVGSEVAWIEIAGIWDHFQHEQSLGKPMAKIFVDEAVIALKTKLIEEIKFQTDNEDEK